MNMKKIIITESQLNRLKNVLNEESIQSSVVRQMKEFLDMNYAPVEKFMREGGEYYETPMIEIKADGEVISPKSLYEYLKYKYNMGEEFTKQVIRDWMYGNINDEHMLSKNVSLNEAKKDSVSMLLPLGPVNTSRPPAAPAPPVKPVRPKITLLNEPSVAVGNVAAGAAAAITPLSKNCASSIPTTSVVSLI